AREGLFAQRPEVDADAAHAIARRRQVDANARARRFTWKERRRTRKFAFVRARAEDAEDWEAAAFEGRRGHQQTAAPPIVRQPHSPATATQVGALPCYPELQALALIWAALDQS